MCDGHYYLAPRELGRQSICEKCGLPVIIGKQVPRPWAWYVAMLLIGAVAGVLVTLTFR